MTIAAFTEEVVAERKRAPSPKRQPDIMLSGDRAGFKGRRREPSEREFLAALHGRPSEPNYSEQLVSEYKHLRNLMAHGAKQDELVECEARIQKLQELEAQQVEQLLDARLARPLGEEARMRASTEALLAKYGQPNG